VHRFFAGEKVVQCFEDLRQKLFGTASLGSRNFLCLGITFRLIFVAAVVLNGFAAAKDGTASLGTKKSSQCFKDLWYA
jgi:hypothetical protein